jgi:hypothetical protein
LTIHCSLIIGRVKTLPNTATGVIMGAAAEQQEEWASWIPQQGEGIMSII